MLHKAVLFHEVIEGLNIKPSGIYVDLTGGGGGHSAGILEKLGPDGKLFIFDRDTQSIQRLKKRFEDSRCVVSEARFSEAFGALQKLGVRAVDGVLADLGFSSIQLEDPTRGLSFQKEGPLDMRLDARLEHTASDLLLSLPEKNLADLFYHYGEEYRSRAVARAVIRCRESGEKQVLQTTSGFAHFVERILGRRGKIHPATKVFQALRIAVNHELEELDDLLITAPGFLKPDGRLAIISFHSLEDRKVKHKFRELAGMDEPEYSLVNKKPIIAGDEELKENPRSRSAKLRILEKS